MKYRYVVIYSGKRLSVWDKKKKTEKIFFFQSFVYGQIHYDEETEKYPNYVHGAVWDIWNNLTDYFDYSD